MGTRIIGNGAASEHFLGPGTLQSVKVRGAVLQGAVYVKRGGAVVGSLAAGSAVGAATGSADPVFTPAAPLVIQTTHAADNVDVDFSAFPKG